MFNIIPLILILISLGVIILIVVKKFPVLANLDVESIQAEREAKFKERIISNRLKRNFFKYYAKIVRATKPIGQAIGNFFKWGQKKLVEFKKNYAKEEVTKGEIKHTINKLFSEVKELIEKEELEQAEDKLIEIIGLDSQNIKAFKSLGDFYFDRKDYHEAKQTFEHVLKLLERESDIYSPTVQAAENGGEGLTEEEDARDIDSQLASVYFDLAIVDKATDNFDGALASINKAFKLEPNNPRYLDTKLEISIIKKDRISALEAYDNLVKVNPENQKLADFKEQIDEL